MENNYTAGTIRTARHFIFENEILKIIEMPSGDQRKLII